MGRAIDMEKDIEFLKQEINNLKNALNTILEGVKTNDKKETTKTNSKASKSSSSKSDARNADAKSKVWFLI